MIQALLTCFGMQQMMMMRLCTLLFTLCAVEALNVIPTKLAEDKNMEQRLTWARQYCILQQQTQACDGFLCQQLFNLPLDYSTGKYD